jgi:hypothetical protein
MTSVLVTLLAAVAAQTATGDQTSVYFRCNLTAPAPSGSHQLELAYFEPEIPPAYAFNLKDPDHLLPNVPQMSMFISNMWPALFVLTVRVPGAKTGRPQAALMLEPNKATPGQASARIGILENGNWSPESYAGTCAYTEGEVAQREWLALLKK